MWRDWVNGVLGLLLILVPFTGMTGDSMTWSLVIVGAVIAVLSFWSSAEQSNRSANYQ